MNDKILKNAKSLKIFAFIFFALSVGVFLSGVIFISGYEISTYDTSMIEASLMQVAQLRYVVAAILALIGTVLFSTSQLINALILGNRE